MGGVDVALGQEEIFYGCGEDVGHTHRVIEDLHRRLETLQGEGAGADLGAGPELMTEVGGQGHQDHHHHHRHLDRFPKHRA
jgi:hypothetical protein